jgi:hypothetical protein
VNERETRDGDNKTKSAKDTTLREEADANTPTTGGEEIETDL